MTVCKYIFFLMITDNAMRVWRHSKWLGGMEEEVKLVVVNECVLQFT